MHACRIAAAAFKQHPFERLQGSMPFVLRQVVERIGVEDSGVNVEGLAGLPEP